MRNTPQSNNHQTSINVLSPASFVSWRLTDQRKAKRWPLTPKWLQVLTQERVRSCNRNSFTPPCAVPLGGERWGGACQPPASAWKARLVPGIMPDIKCVCSLDSEICLQNLIHLDVLSTNASVYCELLPSEQQNTDSYRDVEWNNRNKSAKLKKQSRFLFIVIFALQEHSVAILGLELQPKYIMSNSKTLKKK